MSAIKKTSNIFSTILPAALIGAVILAVSSYLVDFNLEAQTYSNLKGYFFTPLKKWIFVVIAAAMFSVFFRSPKGKSSKFFILLLDIVMLYILSTFIANVYAFGAFHLFPFTETIAPLIADAESINFDKAKPEGIPTIILMMIGFFIFSIVFRYFLHGFFASFAKIICAILVKIFSPKIFDNFSYIKELKDEYESALRRGKRIYYSLSLINFLDKIVFGVLTLILFLAPLAVYASFLEILNTRGFQFFVDLGKFIGFYALILIFYKLFVVTLFRTIFCLGIKGETYISFLKKGLPVIATAATTASSVAALASNIKAAQSLETPKDMQNKGHNRALMPIGATFNMDGTSISLVIYFLLAANLAGMKVSFLWVVLTAVGLSIGTAAVPSASIIMLTSMYSAFSIPLALTSKLLSIIIAVDPIHDRLRTAVNTWGDLNMIYIVQCKRGIITMFSKVLKGKKNKKLKKKTRS